MFRSCFDFRITVKFFFIFILIVFWKSAFALSSKDVDLYKSIFNDYRNGNFKDADRNVEKLDDLIEKFEAPKPQKKVEKKGIEKFIKDDPNEK